MRLTLRLPREWAIMLIACGVCLYLIATISLTVEAAEDEVLDGDVQVQTAVQTTSFPGVHEFVAALNWLGKPIPLAILAGLVAVGLLAVRRYAETMLVAPTMLSHAVNWLLKNLAESPRPTPDLVRVSEQANGFGFPSGHTMATVVFCGVMTYIAWRLIENQWLRMLVQTLAILAVVGIGFSRIYSGAHWPSDVLGGYMWGAFYTAVMVLAFHRIRPLATAEMNRARA